MRNLALKLTRAFGVGRAAPEERAWSVPEGQRVYAIGDIHGRLDLLCRLVTEIERDDAARGPARTTLVFLGDLVDRGPDSRGVIEFLMKLASDGPDCVFLAGNHDEVFARAARGERECAARLDKMGGRQTALSYGISEEEYDRGSFEDLAALMHKRVPREHVAFLNAFEDWRQIGDYVFVHAGIRPGVPMNQQSSADMRWIRNSFLQSDRCHGAMVVHGHTVVEEVEFQPNRIGIDTGAFRTDKLTVLGLEGTDRWLLST